MQGLLRAAFLAASVAAGSWIGLGRPTPHALAPFATATPTATPTLDPQPSSPSPSSSPPAPASTDYPPLPQQRDPAHAPELSAWPSLNPAADTQRAWMVAEGPQHVLGSGRRIITLTFDDGPFLETTPAVLRLLAKYKVHATFFVVGQYLEGEDARSRVTRRLLRQVEAEGHLVGNHTLDHELLTTISHTQVLDQIDRTSTAIERATGKRPTLFRPPFGTIDEFTRQALVERHLDMILWSVESQDMERDDPKAMWKDMLVQLDYKEGGIVLLHDIKWTSIRVLRELLQFVKGHPWDPKHPTKIGYEIVDLPTYLRETEARPLPFASRDELEKARQARNAARR